MMKKYTILTMCCVLFLLQLTGCSGTVNESSADRAAYDTYSYSASESKVMNGATMDYSVEYKTAAEPVSTTVNESGNLQNDLSERKIIKYATLSFETEKYDEFMVSLEQCITSLGGYIESSEAYAGGIYSSRNSRNSHVTVRIPETQYNRFMTDVCAIGTLTYKSEASDDVTMSYVDTESRIRSLETEYDALLEILEKAVSLDDVIQLQARISEVTYQLESYQSQLRKYDDLIAYCTVNMDVSEVWRETQNKDVMSFSERIVSGLEETFYDIGEDFTNLSVWLITSLPYILIWAVIIIAVLLLCRMGYHKQKKKREQKLINQYMNQSDHETKNSNHP